MGPHCTSALSALEEGSSCSIHPSGMSVRLRTSYGDNNSLYLQAGGKKAVPGLRMLIKMDTLTLCHQDTFSTLHPNQHLHI